MKGKYTVALPFLAQIALADLATHDLDRLLPKEGMLWFFAHPDARIGEWQDLQKMASQVIYEPAPRNLAPLAPPSNLHRRGPYLGIASYRPTSGRCRRATAFAAADLPPFRVGCG